MSVSTIEPMEPLAAPQCDAPVVLHARVVTGTGGGPDKTILNSPRLLARHGYRAACAYLHPPDDEGIGEIARRASECKAPLLPVPDRGPFDPAVYHRLLDICRRERVAIWHGHDYKSNLLGLLLRRRWPMKLVTTVHGWVKQTRRTPLYYWIDRQCLKRYDRVICVSDDLLETCIRSGVSPARCRVIENAIDLDEYARQRSIDEAKARLGFHPRRLLVGAVGRLSAEKGFDLLIRAVGSLIDAGTDVGLAIAGEGEERERLERLIAEQSDPSRFCLLGYRADTIDLYQAFDVFALSSLREGLPNVLLEAMALETPVVATRIAGVPRLIEHDQTGLLVEAGDAGALARALDELLHNPARRAAFAAAGRRRVTEKFSFAIRMEKIRDVYDELLGRNGR